MGKPGRPTAVVTLSDADREVLERWARRPSAAGSGDPRTDRMGGGRGLRRTRRSLSRWALIR